MKLEALGLSLIAKVPEPVLLSFVVRAVAALFILLQRHFLRRKGKGKCENVVFFARRRDGRFLQSFGLSSAKVTVVGGHILGTEGVAPFG